MRRIGEELEGILIEIEDRLTFYDLNTAKRSFKPAIFRFSTVCLALFLIITMSPLLTPNYTNSFLRTIYGQGSDNETAPPEIFVPAGDTIPPDIIVRDDITVEVTTGPNGTPVEYAVRAEDNVDGTAILEQDGSTVRQDDVGGSITISCNPPSGFEFPIDNTAVECTATDASGNEGEGFFTITVQEAVVGPQPTIDPLTVGIISNGTEGVAPATFDFEASVIGGTEPYTYSWNFDGDETEDSNESSISHTVEGAGIYDVALTVTDSNGRTASDEIAIIAVPSIGWIVVLVVLASIVIGGIALAKYKMNQRRRGPRMDIPTSAIVEITAKGGIDQ